MKTLRINALESRTEKIVFQDRAVVEGPFVLSSAFRLPPFASHHTQKKKSMTILNNYFNDLLRTSSHESLDSLDFVHDNAKIPTQQLVNRNRHSLGMKPFHSSFCLETVEQRKCRWDQLTRQDSETAFSKQNISWGDSNEKSVDLGKDNKRRELLQRQNSTSSMTIPQRFLSPPDRRRLGLKKSLSAPRINCQTVSTPPIETDESTVSQRDETTDFDTSFSRWCSSSLCEVFCESSSLGLSKPRRSRDYEDDILLLSPIEQQQEPIESPSTVTEPDEMNDGSRSPTTLNSNPLIAESLENSIRLTPRKPLSSSTRAMLLKDVQPL